MGAKKNKKNSNMNMQEEVLVNAKEPHGNLGKLITGSSPWFSALSVVIASSAPQNQPAPQVEHGSQGQIKSAKSVSAVL